MNNAGQLLETECFLEKRFRSALPDVRLPQVDHPISLQREVSEPPCIALDGLDLNDAGRSIGVAPGVAVMKVALALHHDIERRQEGIRYPSANAMLGQEVNAESRERVVRRHFNRGGRFGAQSVCDGGAEAGARAVAFPILQRRLVVPLLTALFARILDEIRSLDGPRSSGEPLTDSGAESAATAVRCIDDLGCLDRERLTALFAVEGNPSDRVGRLGVAALNRRPVALLGTEFLPRCRGNGQKRRLTYRAVARRDGAPSDTGAGTRAVPSRAIRSPREAVTTNLTRRCYRTSGHSRIIGDQCHA